MSGNARGNQSWDLDNEIYLRRPRFARGFIWEGHTSPSVLDTLNMEPLPSPPLNELSNIPALSTISSHPSLFKVITPINVDRFEHLLSTHPNRPFVDSVCRGLRKGFWPWADTSNDYPITWDQSDRPLKEARHREFVRQHRNKEISKGRFSASFGPNLLPGMYSMPIGVIPKPGSDKLRLVIDHSAGPYALNAMIDRRDAYVRYDGIPGLGQALRAARDSHPKEALVVFKSDVSDAYRIIPMHPLWQIRQIVTIDANRHVDRCSVIGGRGSGRLFWSFMSLVLWIARFVKSIEDVLAYMDDNFSWELARNKTFYPPYGRRMPTKQVRLLSLWDELGIPHEDRKQVSGSILPIIGFEIDTRLMRATLSKQRREVLVSAISEFCSYDNSNHILRDFQRLAGWINWALNVYPRLRPGLSSLYEKITGKTHTFDSVWVNQRIRNELLWIADHVASMEGVSFLFASMWSTKSADLTIFTDASLSGMACFIPANHIGLMSAIPSSIPHDTIFYYEALAVCYAVFWASKRNPIPRRLLVYTDNRNTVDIFNTLRASGPFNKILLFVCNMLMDYDFDLRVLYIPTEDNVIADALSRHNPKRARSLDRSISIKTFTLPSEMMKELS